MLLSVRTMDSKLHFSKRELPMRLAELASTRCNRLLRSKIGACIVDENFRVISYGFNGFTHVKNKEISSSVFEAHTDPIKFICCAAPNAIYHSMSSPENKIMYITSFPCVECAKAIVQSGIKKVYYLEINDDHSGETNDISKAILMHGLDEEPQNFISYMRTLLMNSTYEFKPLTKEGELLQRMEY